MARLDKLSVSGFKSIERLTDFELRNLNVLIGPNGSGKSNFISIFELFSYLAERKLQLYVQINDGPDMLLHGTRSESTTMGFDIRFGENSYEFSLLPTGNKLVFLGEVTGYAHNSNWFRREHGSGHSEAITFEFGKDDTFAPYIMKSVKNWRVYHFHDTSRSSPMRQAQPVRDNLRLKENAGNIAPYLRYLHQKFPVEYARIVDTVRRIAPFFGEFVHREDPGERVELEWFQYDVRDTVYSPRQLSDGTMRFICLTTLLLQPASLQPDTILIDEPELGLHPAAQGLLAAMIQRVSESKQVIISTQSPTLVSEFEPEDVIVVDLKNGASIFRRLDSEELGDWLEDYSLGEIWEKNVVGGRP